MKRIILLQIVFFLFTGASHNLISQELVIIPNGVLESGDKALVIGDYVRVRSGPSLEHRIITKVNKETAVTVLVRDNAPVTINDMKNYWYNIKLDENGTEGWMFGHYLRKREIPETPVQAAAPPPQEKIESMGIKPLSFVAMGSISEPPSILTSGDLNQNGTPEIVFINREKRNGYWSLTGYEADGSGTEKKGYQSVYKIKLRNTDIQTVKIFTEISSDSPLLVVSGKSFSHIYSYDAGKNLLRPVYKIDSPFASIGKLDGNNSFLIYTRKNKINDNDGTTTYFIHAAPLDFRGGRISLKERIGYTHPLPVKKLLVFDLDNDKNSEIICEIGGKEHGGGVVVLSFIERTLKKTLNSGITTYNDNQFAGMWGIAVRKNPKLFIYTTDPDMGNDAGTSFGFLATSLKNETLFIERFYPLNKLLDDINNRRVALLHNEGKDNLPFIVLDYNEDSREYKISKPLLQ